MKKLLILFSLILGITIISYGQSDAPSVIKGQKISTPTAGYGTDTINAYTMKNANANGMAGFIGITGNDSLYLTVDKDSIRLFGTKPLSLPADSYDDTGKVSTTGVDTLYAEYFIKDTIWFGNKADSLMIFKDINGLWITYNDFNINPNFAYLGISDGYAYVTTGGNTLTINEATSKASFTKSVDITDSLILGMTSDKSKLYDNGTNFVIDSDNPIHLDTDTILFSNDTITDIVPLNQATGNLANSVTKMDTIFTALTKTNKITVNNTASGNSLLTIHGNNTGGKNLFCFTDKIKNKNTTTFAQESDTSAFSFTTSSTGKPTLKFTNVAGVPWLNIDTARVYFSGTANSSEMARGNNVAPFMKIAYSTASAAPALQLLNIGNSGTGTAPHLGFAQIDGGGLISGDLLGWLSFGGGIGTAQDISYFASMRCAVDGTPANNDYPSRIMFYTVLDGASSQTERFRINNAGGQIWTPVNTGNITAGTGITAAMCSYDMRYNGNSAIDISANPQIADGVDGQEIKIIGLSDTNTLLLEDGNGLQLAGGVSFTLGLGDVIQLTYVASLDIWVEQSRSDN